jgi:hypothetical protein
LTKLERAIEEAEKLPPELREKLGDDLLHTIHKLLALRYDVAAGVAELDAGEGIAADEIFTELKGRYGA